MDDVDFESACERFRICFEIEQKESLESLFKGRDVSGVLPTGFGKSPLFQLFVLAKYKVSNLRCGWSCQARLPPNTPTGGWGSRASHARSRLRRLAPSENVRKRLFCSLCCWVPLFHNLRVHDFRKYDPESWQSCPWIIGKWLYNYFSQRWNTIKVIFILYEVIAIEVFMNQFHQWLEEYNCKTTSNSQQTK